MKADRRSLAEQRPKEISIKVTGLKLQAKCWGESAEPETQTILALHGWLDNAASFDFLAPLILNHRIIALDLPGHGASDHPVQRGHYHFVDYVGDVFAAAQSLGLKQFGIMGHSMGAGIAALAAACMPEQITCAIFIEGLGPQSTPAEQSPKILQKALKQQLKQQQLLQQQQLQQQVLTNTCYPSFAEAVSARLAGNDMHNSSATQLAKRGVIQLKNGYSWGSDPKLKGQSSLRLDEAQVSAFLAQIAAPSLLIEANESFLKRWQTELNQRKALVANLKTVHLTGGHHLHMDNPDAVAAAINHFLHSQQM